MKSNLFILKLKKFFKRNAYSIAVGTCAVFALFAITLAAVISTTTTKDVGSESGNLPIETVTPTAVIFSSPIEGADITKEFANDKLLEDKTTGYWQTHSGIDIAASAGTSVLAVFDGTVTAVEKTMMEGAVITISHTNNLVSVYKCLSENNIEVAIGDSVKKGEKIGEVGESLKEKADGAHLHFEVHEDGKPINPTIYLENDDK
ncbi:MAG: M23 family metallopeptidase [Clostridia bacterium]|nr:M23 family metallopeptidase [Clostridia bacterium]